MTSPFLHHCRQRIACITGAVISLATKNSIISIVFTGFLWLAEVHDSSQENLTCPGIELRTTGI
jgi:hypothetical protein